MQSVHFEKNSHDMAETCVTRDINDHSVGTLPAYFSQAVRRFPHGIAIKTGRIQITYQELDRLSDRMAGAVLHLCGEKKEPVAVLCDHGAGPIIAVMGILKAGKPYTALNSVWPLSDLIRIVNDTGTSLIVSDSDSISLAGVLAENRCRLVNADQADDYSYNGAGSEVSVSPDSPSAVFFTSGTSGESKGIEVSHRFILHSVSEIIDEYHIGIGDRQTLLHPVSFNASSTSIFTTLLSGAALYPYDAKNSSPEQLINWLYNEEITILHSPIPLFRKLLETEEDTEKFSKLRLVRMGGQTLYRKDVERFRQCFPADCLFLHTYASTEALISTKFCMDRQTDISDFHIIPAGYAARGKEILLLDENYQKLGFNETGEIAVRSRCLSPGYWRNPELTAQKFLPDPEGGDKRIYLTGDLGRMRPDGCLELLGRKDFQVKIRGFRVEIEAVEAALHGLETVKEAAVKALDHPSGEKYLAAYVVPAQQPAPTVSAIRRALSEKLPEYMIPSVFVMMEKLPLTTTGKTDRRALPEPEKIRPGLDTPFVPPSSEEEKQIAQIWAEILELDQVGIHDSFFDLGGNSIQSMRIVSRICRIFQTDLSMRIFFDFPTVAGLAAYITENRDKPISDAELEKIVTELEMLSDEEAEQLLNGSTSFFMAGP